MFENKFQIIKDNICRIKEDNSVTNAVTDAVLYDAAKLVLDMNPTITPREAYDFFVSLCDEDSNLAHFAKFCQEIITLSIDIQTENLSLSLTDTVYPRNPFTDKAYEIFSKSFAGLRAVYSHDFKSSCEDVYYDRTDSCILPLENSSDGLLMPFRNMLIKYELKIAAITQISGNEDSHQSLALVTDGDINTCGNVLEVYLPKLTSRDFLEICLAVNNINCEVLRITSVGTTDELCDHHICFTSGSNNSLSALKYFLSGIYPAYIILGQYKI